MAYKGGVKIFLLLLIIVFVGLSAVMFSFDDHGVAENMQNKAQEVLRDGSEKVIDKVAEEGRVAVGEKLKETGEKMMTVENNDPGAYQKYEENIVAQYEKNILFFTASWCPSCMEADKNILSQKNMIPTAMAIYAVDYDTAVQLREKYHVDKQHTFVQIDRSGNEITRWTNSTTVEDIVSHMQ